MKSSLKLKLTALATTLVASFGAMAPAAASLFDQTEVRQDDFIAIASPVGQTGNHQLLIVEQVSDSRDCWSESGSSPTLVEPLLLNFNFSGICGRSTDSNGYSIRAGGEDLGLGDVAIGDFIVTYQCRWAYPHQLNVEVSTKDIIN